MIMMQNVADLRFCCCIGQSIHNIHVEYDFFLSFRFLCDCCTKNLFGIWTFGELVFFWLCGVYQTIYLFDAVNCPYWLV